MRLQFVAPKIPPSFLQVLDTLPGYPSGDPARCAFDGLAASVLPGVGYGPSESIIGLGAVGSIWPYGFLVAVARQDVGDVCPYLLVCPEPGYDECSVCALAWCEVCCDLPFVVVFVPVSAAARD